MLIAFFDSESIIHHEFVLGGATVNATYYVEMPSRLWDNV
jgi:hypothetical protein